MKEIKLNTYEINFLVRTLQYAKKKKKEDLANGLIAEGLYVMETEEINLLLQRARGVFKYEIDLRRRGAE